MKQRFSLLILFFITHSIVFAQDKDSFENEQIKNGFTVFAAIKKDKSILATIGSKMELLKNITKSDNSISFEKVSTINIDTGLVQDKLQLYKNGIKIRGGEYVIHSGLTEVKFVHGFFSSFENENFSVANSKEREHYADIALKVFNNNHRDSNAVKGSIGIVKNTDIIYYYDYNKEKYRAAYQAHIISENGLYEENVFISAVSGEFLGAENLICSINFTGTAQTQYNGGRNIVTDAPTVAGPFRLQETRNGVLIRTRNMNNRNDLSSVTEFSDNDNNWTAAEHAANRAALDAHWAAETVFDYWRTVHNRNSINGSGMTIESYVHWNTNEFNARWSSSSNSMQYGDGPGGNNPLTALDICAHEFGHGIDQFTGNLAYERESGALDEGFADIWGAVIEAWALPAKQRWILGEDIVGGPFRSMSNPNAVGQPDTYLNIGNGWINTAGCTPSLANDYCGVHTNSGVLNHWFFLISDGGNGINANGTAYNIAGLGITNAARIAYRTKLLMNNSLADFAMARNMSIQAAEQLFGVNSCTVATVTNAWNAVGVGTAFIGVVTNIPITGSFDLCSGSQVYTIPGTSAVWTPVIPTGVATYTTAGNSLTLAKGAGTGNVTLNVTATNACGSSSGSGTKTVMVGNPSAPTSIVGFTVNGTQFAGNTVYNFSVMPPPFGITGYQWMVSYGTILSGQGTDYISVRTGVETSTPATFSVRVRWSNTCGWSSYFIRNGTIGGGAWRKAHSIDKGDSLMSLNSELENNEEDGKPMTWQVFPNPAINILTVKGSKQLKPMGITEIVIYDVTGNIKKSIRYNTVAIKQDVDIMSLQTGTYFVEIKSGGGTERRKILVLK